MRDFIPFACLSFTLGSLLLLYLFKDQWLRKFFLITLTIIAILEGLFILNAHAAIDAGTVWEVRTTGNQLWGGGFVSLLPDTSTDYSQANNCQASWKAVAASCAGTNKTNDLASTNASGGLTLTSAAGGFTDAMVGNVIHITAGTNFTPGWYQITAYASANSVTITPKCNVGTNDASAGTGYLGGAFLIGGTLDDDFFDVPVAGNTVYIQSGVYTGGESISAAGVGTLTLPINFIGYITGRTTIPYGTDRPTLALGNSYNLTFNNYSIVKNLIITKTGGAAGALTLGTNSILKNCKVLNSTATANQPAVGPNTAGIFSCDIASTNGYAINATVTLTVYGSYIHDSVIGINMTTGAMYVMNNIFDTLSTSAITMGASTSGTIYGNTFYNGSSPTGIAISATTAYAYRVLNNIFSGFLTPLVWDTEEKSNFFNYNLYYNEGYDQNTNVTEGPNSITDVDPGFIAPTANPPDFRVGTGAKALGYPGDWVHMGLSADCVGYPDIGAVQRIEPTGGRTGGAYSF